MMLLTQAERDRFATYLEQDAASTDGIIEQMLKLPDAVMSLVAVRYKREADAARIIAAKLRATHDS